MGGEGELVNLVFGREIQKAYGQQPQDIAVFPLLEGTDGVQKMSKSPGNYVGISEPPEQIYGKTMSIPDSVIEKYVRLLSGLDAKQQAAVLEMKPRDAKAALARQLVKRLHGEEAAARAEADFDRKFRQHELPVMVEEEHLADARNVVDVLVETKLAKSRNEARRLIEQSGVRVDGQKVGPDYEVKGVALLQVGERNLVWIRLR